MAGGPITVTDRISVRVSAKTQEQSASQKRDVGGAIAKTLGKENVSDSLKDQLGNTKNPVITDENGDTWVSTDDLKDAGKAMNAAGAFMVDEIHHGLTDSDGVLYNYENVYAAPVDVYINPDNGDRASISVEWGSCYVVFNGGLGAYCFSAEDFSVWYTYGLSVNCPGDPATVTINNVNYSLFHGYVAPSSLYWLNDQTPGVQIQSVDAWRSAKHAAGFLFGAVTPAGNQSSIDWTKPDNEIDPQIHELFDTMRTMDGKDYVKVAIAEDTGGESGSGDSGSGGGHTGGDF